VPGQPAAQQGSDDTGTSASGGLTPSKAATGEPRRVDWLELFFDLVFVVIVKQLADLLHGDPGLADFAEVAGIMLVAWLAWLNVTSFVNLSGDRSVNRRVPVLVSMAGVGLIAIAIPEATGSGAILFAVGYAVARVAMWPVWIIVNRGTDRSTLLATLFGPGIALLWILSILVPESGRVWVWVALVAAEIALWVPRLARVPFGSLHLLERVGLFTLIVLGESVVGLILAVRIDQSTSAWIVSALAFVLICSIWWLYYQAGAPLAERMLEHGPGPVLRDVIVVAHFFIILGLIGVAAGLGAALAQADDATLTFGALVSLCGGAGLYHLSQVMISWRYGIGTAHSAILGLLAVAVPCALILFGFALAPWAIIAILIAHSACQGVVSAQVTSRLRTPPQHPRLV
jgi:low temperature requirement protein LtrA